MIRVGQQAKVWVETQDGMLMKADVITVEMQTTMDISGLRTAEMRMTVVGKPAWMESRDVAKEVAARRTAAEWRCDYCNGVNKREHTHCGYCGATRSFLYG